MTWSCPKAPRQLTPPVYFLDQIPKALSQTIEGEKMSDCPHPNSTLIRENMIVLDIVSTFKSTQAVFKLWEEKTGECICCNALFESLDTFAAKYGLDLCSFLDDLENAAIIIDKPSEGTHP
ncbi:hypothetical protein [Desulfobacula phenolica]|uniref:hypothetical protein n=1 Tax=Desulfobacula phenolica TaxID=90732 RepID=UPI001FE241B3|nr:hypothetical protein [Desulfobacula phenolica]